MRFELSQGFEARNRMLVAHLKVQTKQTNAHVKLSDDGTLRVRIYDRYSERVLLEKEWEIGAPEYDEREVLDDDGYAAPARERERLVQRAEARE